MKDDLIAAAQRALEALEARCGTNAEERQSGGAITALRAALEAPEPLRTVTYAMKAEGWRQCAVGQRVTQHCGLLETAVLAEREACARVCDEVDRRWVNQAEKCAERIRARGGE